MSKLIVVDSKNVSNLNKNVYSEAFKTIFAFVHFIKIKSIAFIILSLYFLIVVLSLLNTAYITSKWLDNPLSFISVLHTELGFTHPVFWSFFVVGLIGAGVLEVVRHTLKELFLYTKNRNFFIAVVTVTLFLISYVFLTMSSVENRAKIENQKTMEINFKNSENYKSTKVLINRNLAEIKILQSEKSNYLKSQKRKLSNIKIVPTIDTRKFNKETWADRAIRIKKMKAKIKVIYQHNAKILSQNSTTKSTAKNSFKKINEIDKKISALQDTNLELDKNLSNLLKGYLIEGNKNAGVEAMQFKIISIVLEVLAIAGFVLKVLHLRTHLGNKKEEKNKAFPTVSHRFQLESDFGGKSEIVFYQNKVSFFDGESNNKSTHILKDRFYKVILGYIKISDILNVEIGGFLNTSKQAKNIIKELNGGSGYRGEILTATIKILKILGFIEQKNSRYILLKEPKDIKNWLDESFKKGVV